MRFHVRKICLMIIGVCAGHVALAQIGPTDPILNPGYDASVGIVDTWTVQGLANSYALDFSPEWNGVSFSPYSNVNVVNNPSGPGTSAAELFPTPQVYANTGSLAMCGPGGPCSDAAVTIGLTYYAEVYDPNLAPGPAVMVPLFFSGSYLLSGNDTLTNVNLTVGNIISPLAQVSEDCSAGCTSAYSPFTGTIEVKANTPFLVTLGADAFSQTGLQPATAIIDPYFYVDPTWAAANPGFSVKVTPGMGNTPVPLPATGWLMLLGLGGLGAMVRGRVAA